MGGGAYSSAWNPLLFKTMHWHCTIPSAENSDFRNSAFLSSQCLMPKNSSLRKSYNAGLPPSTSIQLKTDFASQLKITNPGVTQQHILWAEFLFT